MSAYRSPAPMTLVPRVEHQKAPLCACPQCGAVAYACSGCGRTRTDITYCQHFACGYYQHCSDTQLPSSHGTSLEKRLCAPTRRVRVGPWYWPFTRCDEPSVHVHHKCQRCGWRGIAVVKEPREVG